MTPRSAANVKVNTRGIAYIAVSVALIAVCSWISIPTAVPFTLQTLGIFLAVGLLGGRRGTAAVAVYILLGAAGLPVYGQFTGGLGILLGYTGGYFLGFFLTALLLWGMERLWGRSLLVLGAGMVLSLPLCYACGLGWARLFYYPGESFWTLLAWFVFPYILPDLGKAALALALIRRLRRCIPEARPPRNPAGSGVLSGKAGDRTSPLPDGALPDPLPLRPHHGMCLRYFRGQGYSREFSVRMAQIQAQLTAEHAVTLTEGLDEICAACPNRPEGRCADQEKTGRYDRGVLEICGLRAGESLPYGDFAALVEERILAPGRRAEICGDCQWNHLCGGGGERE